MSSENQAAPSQSIPQHVVCTHAQARAFIEKENRFQIAICGCRQSRGGCSRSRMDVCLMFNPEFSTGTEKREATTSATRRESATKARCVNQPTATSAPPAACAWMPAISGRAASSMGN